MSRSYSQTRGSASDRRDVLPFNKLTATDTIFNISALSGRWDSFNQRDLPFDSSSKVHEINWEQISPYDIKYDKRYDKCLISLLVFYKSTMEVLVKNRVVNHKSTDPKTQGLSLIKFPLQNNFRIPEKIQDYINRNLVFPEDIILDPDCFKIERKIYGESSLIYMLIIDGDEYGAQVDSPDIFSKRISDIYSEIQDQINKCIYVTFCQIMQFEFGIQIRAPAKLPYTKAWGPDAKGITLFSEKSHPFIR